MATKTAKKQAEKTEITIELVPANSRDERIEAASAAIDYICKHYEVSLAIKPVIHVNGQPLQVSLRDARSLAPKVQDNGEA